MALLAGVLLAVDFFAERALRHDYERTGFEQLEAIARIAQARPPQFSSSASDALEDSRVARDWAARMAPSGARITVITASGEVLADSQSDPNTMENHADRPEVQQALAQGNGRSIRHSATVQRDLLYYAARQPVPGRSPVILRFALPVENVAEFLWNFRKRLWVSSLVILFMAGTLALLISRSVSRRVERLQEFSRRVAEGDFRPLPADPSGDALEKLGVSLSETSARLEDTIRSLTDERNLSAAIFGSMVEGVAVVDAAVVHRLVLGAAL